MQLKPTPQIDSRFIMTNRGLMKCTVADFDKQKYKGLNQRHSNGKHVALKPTNVGDPKNRK